MNESFTKKIRLHLNLSIHEMLTLLNVSRSTYEKWESGASNPTAASKKMLETLVWLDEKSMLDEFKKSNSRAK